MNSFNVGLELKSQSLIRRAVYLCACKLKIVCSIVWQLLNALAIILKRAFNCFMVTLIVFECTFVFNGQRQATTTTLDFFSSALFCFSISTRICYSAKKNWLEVKKRQNKILSVCRFKSAVYGWQSLRYYAGDKFIWIK